MLLCWRLEKIIPAKGHVRKRDPGVVLCEPCENIWRRGCEMRFHNWCSARMKREWRVNCPPFRLFFSFHQHKLFLKKLVSFISENYFSLRVYKIFHQNKQSSPHYDRIKKNIYKRSPVSCAQQLRLFCEIPRSYQWLGRGSFREFILFFWFWTTKPPPQK